MSRAQSGTAFHYLLMVQLSLDAFQTEGVLIELLKYSMVFIAPGSYLSLMILGISLFHTLYYLESVVIM